MELSSMIALSKMATEFQQMDIIANNLANVDTPGYKAEQLQFQSFVSKQEGVGAPPGGTKLYYADIKKSYRNWKEGNFVETGDQYDLAIGNPKGFFTVMTKNGPRLTRNGSFLRLPDGVLANASGYPVLSQTGQPIQIPIDSTKITVAPDGVLSDENGILARIGITEPSDLNNLRPVGGTLFENTGPSATLSDPNILQGTIEQSNVNPVLALVHMMQVQKTFQLISNFIEAEQTRQKSVATEMAAPIIA